MTWTTAEIASKIDHTLLKAEAPPTQIDTLCAEAVEFRFAAVCVNPVYVARAVQRLEVSRSGTLTQPFPVVAAVVGFPLGANRTDIKADEAKRALDDGASEIDMVISLGALIAGDAKGVRHDIETLSHVVHRAGNGLILKVIVETSALTNEQIILGCRCAMEGEADFVKTSTGFHPTGGATIEHVKLLHKHGSPMLVKASGGIRTAQAAIAMLDAGAARLGTSSGPAILKELL
ncbi:MAG: deoxyribose-phosphate aldolase [Planctomycetota bacterium]